MTSIFYPPKFQALNLNGFVESGAKLYFYAVGTSTAKAVYSDVDLTIEHTQPVVADSSGFFDAIYLNGAYKAVLDDASDVQIWSQDYVTGNDANYLTYDQGDTGAVSRPVETRLQDFVTAKDFGCTGDGSTDDTVTLTAAIAAQAGDSLFITPGTYLVSSTIALPSDTAINLLPGSVIRQTTTGDASVFSLAEGTSGQMIVGEGRLEGPYHSSTPAPIGAYPAGNGAIRINGDYDSISEDVRIEGIEIKGWGDYGIFAENATNLSVRHCHIHKCGRDGFRGYGVEFCSIESNVVHNISPGLSGVAPTLNAYGITFTRRSDSGGTVVTNPPSRNSICANNVVYDIPGWKCLDTHGGQYISFNNNYVRDAYIAIGIDEGDTSGNPGDAEPLKISVNDNTIVKGDGEAGGIAINVASSTFTDPAQDIKVDNNQIFGEWGETNWGAILFSFVSGGTITNNSIDDANTAAIRFPVKSEGIHMAGNVIKNLTGTMVAAIVNENADSIITMDSGTFLQTTGSYTAFSLGTPNTGKGLKFDFNGLDFIGAITRFAAGEEDRTRADEETITGTATLDSSVEVSLIDSSAGAVTGTLNEGPRRGWVKTIVMTDSSNSSTVSVGTHETSDPEVITFAAVDDTAVLLYTGSEWITIKLSGATV